MLLESVDGLIKINATATALLRDSSGFDARHRPIAGLCTSLFTVYGKADYRAEFDRVTRVLVHSCRFSYETVFNGPSILLFDLETRKMIEGRICVNVARHS